MPVTSRGVSTRERPGSMQSVEAVFEADALDAGVAGGFDDGADDGVQTGRVAAAGEHADARDRRHARLYQDIGRAFAGSKTACYTSGDVHIAVQRVGG